MYLAAPARSFRCGFVACPRPGRSGGWPPLPAHLHLPPLPPALHPPPRGPGSWWRAWPPSSSTARPTPPPHTPPSGTSRCSWLLAITSMFTRSSPWPGATPGCWPPPRSSPSTPSSSRCYPCTRPTPVITRPSPVITCHHPTTSPPPGVGGAGGAGRGCVHRGLLPGGGAGRGGGRQGGGPGEEQELRGGGQVGGRGGSPVGCRRFWAQAGVEERVTLHLGPALDTLHRMVQVSLFLIPFLLVVEPSPRRAAGTPWTLPS